MFCPECKDEFRAGFTHCASCDVPLVDDLSGAAASRTVEPPRLTAPLRMADYCGFLDLDEARQSRERLRAEGIRSDILIREVPVEPSGSSFQEEYWLRIDATKSRQAAALLDYAASAAIDEGQTLCDACGATMSSQESFCSACGHRFEGR